MKKILIVDDEFLIRYSLSHMLRGTATEVNTASSGIDALREIVRGSYDLCCLDIHLPDLNGMEVMRKIRKLSPQTKIILMTGDEVTEEMMSEIRKNTELLLSKPFDLFKVKTFINRILEADGYAHPNETEFMRTYQAFEYWLMNDQRRHERQPVAQQIIVTPLSEEQKEQEQKTQQEQKAQIVDISEGGMCLMTNCPLRPGLVVKIIGNAPNDCTGTVRWNQSTGNGNTYRTGIQLFPPEGR